MSITSLAAYFSPAHTMGSVGLFIDQPLVDRFGKTRPSATRIELIGDMKKQLAEDINKFCAPIRERILDMAANTEYLDKVARMGAEKARESASKTLNEVRQIIGFSPY